MKTKEHNFDTFKFTEVTETFEQPIEGETVNKLDELLNELKNPPPPIDEPETETPPEPPEGGKGEPSKPNPLTPSNNNTLVTANEGQIMTAKLGMMGIDSLFAFAAVAVSKRPDKYEFYKAAERDLNNLSKMGAEVLAYYKIEMSPVVPFFMGFVGIYGAKSFEVFQDMQNKNKTVSDLKTEREYLEALEEIKAIKNDLNKPQSKSARGVKPGTKRGSYKK